MLEDVRRLKNMAITEMEWEIASALRDIELLICERTGADPFEGWIEGTMTVVQNHVR